LNLVSWHDSVYVTPSDSCFDVKSPCESHGYRPVQVRQADSSITPMEQPTSQNSK